MTKIQKTHWGGHYESPELFDVSLIESESVALSPSDDWVESTKFKFNNTYNVFGEEEL